MVVYPSDANRFAIHPVQDASHECEERLLDRLLDERQPELCAKNEMDIDSGYGVGHADAPQLTNYIRLSARNFSLAVVVFLPHRRRAGTANRFRSIPIRWFMFRRRLSLPLQRFLRESSILHHASL